MQWEKNLLLLVVFSYSNSRLKQCLPLFKALALGVAPPSLPGALFAAPDLAVGDD